MDPLLHIHSNRSIDPQTNPSSRSILSANQQHEETINQIRSSSTGAANSDDDDYTSDSSTDDDADLLPTPSSTFGLVMSQNKKLSASNNSIKLVDPQQQQQQPLGDPQKQTAVASSTEKMMTTTNTTPAAPAVPSAAYPYSNSLRAEELQAAGEATMSPEKSMRSIQTATTIASTDDPSPISTTALVVAGPRDVVVADSSNVGSGEERPKEEVDHYQNNVDSEDPQVQRSTSGALPSHLMSVGGRAGQTTTLYDREKEMTLLKDEYRQMIKRAREQNNTTSRASTASSSLHSHSLSEESGDSDDDLDLDFAQLRRGRQNKNLTSIICIAGKAGSGKTSLVQTWMQQEVSAAATLARNNGSSTLHDPSQFSGGFFLWGKFDWPTSSITSTLPASPYVGEGSIRGSARFNLTGGGSTFSMTSGEMSNQPALAQEKRDQHEPFQAFGMALDHLLHQIQAKGPRVADDVRDRVLRAIGASSVIVLQELSSEWGEFLLSEHSSDDDDDDDDGDDSDNHYDQAAPEQPTSFADSTNKASSTRKPAKDNKTKTKGKSVRVDNRVPRLKYVLRQLFRAVCDGRHPCVLILDDAQWSDAESLELAHHLHADFENPWFMLVLTWRTNDIHEEEACYTAVGSSIGIFANDLVRRINLSNMSLEAVTLSVAEALQMPTTDVTSLSKLVHNKTNGNPFFVKQFLEYLEKEALLKWRPARQLWRWDESKIADLVLSYNFLELVVAKLRRLSTLNLVVLQVVSCLGQAFEEESACVIIEKMDTNEMFGVEITHTDAMACFDSLVRNGFLVRHGPSTVSSFSLRTSFPHDQIQEAAFQMIPKDVRSLLQLRIGERLLEIMEEQGTETVSYLGVDLCSKGISFLSTKERMGLALYNLLAGEKCMARASFATALAYFEFGLASLRVNDWLKGRLSLELSFGAMESAFCVDDFDKVRLHYDRITSSGSNSDDKIRAHVLLIRATGTRGDAKEALETGYRVLKSMGVKTMVENSNKVSMFVHLTKTKMALRKHTEETLANLRELSGTKLRQAMCIVEVMLPFAYSHDRQLFMLLVMKSVRWSVKYGVSVQSPLVFAALGSFPAFQAMDMRLSTSLGQASLRLLQRFGSRDHPGMVLFMVHSQILNWSLEPQVVQQHLEKTHRVSMENGDILSGYCSLAAAYAVSYESGHTKLEELETLGETYSLRMKESQCDMIASVHDVTWQTVLNLRGDSSREAELTGRAMNQDEALLKAIANGNELLEFTILSRRLQMCYFAGEYDKAEQLRQKSESSMKSVASSPHLVSHVAYCALNCLALCASDSPAAARKNSNYKTANKLLKKLNHWQNDQGYKFCGHMIKLVQAEFDRVDGRFSVAEQNYQSAIYNAGQQGSLRDQGLAHELAGRFFISVRKDEIWAAHHFDLAIQTYHSWGATTLVNKLLDKYGDLVSRDPQHSEVSGHLISSQSRESSVV